MEIIAQGVGIEVASGFLQGHWTVQQNKENMLELDSEW